MIRITKTMSREANRVAWPLP